MLLSVSASTVNRVQEADCLSPNSGRISLEIQKYSVGKIPKPKDSNGLKLSYVNNGYHSINHSGKHFINIPPKVNDDAIVKSID